MEKKIEDLIEYYYNRIDEIDRKYFFTQDKEMGRIDFKKRSKTDILIKEIYEDFLADLKKLNNQSYTSMTEIKTDDKLINHVRNVKLLQAIHSDKKFFVECFPTDTGARRFPDTNFAVKEIELPNFDLFEEKLGYKWRKKTTTPSVQNGEEWISVEDRLPKSKKNVYVWDVNNGIVEDYYIRGEVNGWAGSKPKDITHWIEKEDAHKLIQPPKQ